MRHTMNDIIASFNVPASIIIDADISQLSIYLAFAFDRN